MGQWNDFAKQLRPRLLKGPERFRVEEIVTATGTRDTSVRSPSWWNAVKKGQEAYRAFADEGITCDYEVSEDGEVTSVRFYLEWLRPKDAK